MLKFLSRHHWSTAWLYSLGLVTYTLLDYFQSEHLSLSEGVGVWGLNKLTRNLAEILVSSFSNGDFGLMLGFWLLITLGSVMMLVLFSFLLSPLRTRLPLGNRILTGLFSSSAMACLLLVFHLYCTSYYWDIWFDYTPSAWTEMAFPGGTTQILTIFGFMYFAEILRQVIYHKVLSPPPGNVS